MSPQEKKNKGRTTGSHTVPSKDMLPFPESFGPVFFKNQFRTKITVPTKYTYPNVIEEGSCAIITGSNTGLGFEAAKQLLSLGLTHLVMAVRSLGKGETAAKKLHAAAVANGNTSAKIDVWQLDMESYQSILSFAQKCRDELTQIDFVILNAGLAPMTFSTVPSTSHEKAIQVNHISTVLLTILLLPILQSKRTGSILPARLTIVNSVTAHLCKLPNKDKRPFLSSFDNTDVTPGIQKRAEYVDPTDVIVNMVDPGLTKGTGLSKDAKGAAGIAAKAFFAVAGRPVDKGAATYIDAVLGHGKEVHGSFLMNCQIAPLSRWFYSDGKSLTDLIWKETIEELRFADVERIVSSMRRNI